MPAKANPVLLEAAKGCAMDAEHEADKVSAYAFEGQLQLNAWLPFLAAAVVACFESLERSLGSLVAVVPLLRADEDRIARNLRSSNLLLNLLVPRLGYNRVKELFRELGGPEAGGLEPRGAGYAAAPEAVAAAYIDLVAAKSGLPREIVAETFEPLKATSPSRIGQ
jgi:hypothetical protein